MAVSNVSAAIERSELISQTDFRMSPEEKARLDLEVDNINKQTFAGRRLPKSQLDMEDFLQLFTAQFKYQDPTSPVQDIEFLGQMAQFSSLQQMSSMNKTFTDFSNTLTGSAAANAVGKKVDLDLGSSQLSGYITAATRGANPEVMVNGNWYGWSAVKTIYAE